MDAQPFSLRAKVVERFLHPEPHRAILGIRADSDLFAVTVIARRTKGDAKGWLTIETIGPERVLDVGPEHSTRLVHGDSANVLDVDDLQQNTRIRRGDFVDPVRFR